MTDQPFWWHAEESWRAEADAYRAGRDRNTRRMHEEDVPTSREAEADE